jgi:hypothetical protein
MGYGDEKVVVEVTDGQDGALEHVTKDGKKLTFYPASRFNLDVQELQFWQYLREPGDNDSVPVMVPQLRGKARLEDYGISVIGEPDNKTRTLDVQLLAAASHPDPENLDKEALGIFTFSKPVGVAHLGFNRADWEIGNANEWWLCCYVPEVMHKALVDAVTAGTLTSVGISLHMKNLFSDGHPYAPVSMRNTFYLRPNRSDNTIKLPETARGYVMNMGASFAKVDMRPVEIAEDDTDKEHLEVREVPPDPVAVAVAALTTKVAELRSTIKWVGGIAAVALLMLAFK